MGVLDVLFSGQLLFAALLTGALYAIVAVGLNMVYGTMRLLNVAHGDLVMIGAYGAYWFFTGFGLSPLAAAPVVAVGCALLGLVLYRLLFAQLLRTTGNPVQLEARSLLLFFGLSMVIQNIMATLETATPRAYQYLEVVYRVGGLAMTGNRLAALLVALAVCIAVALFLRFSVFGLALRGVIERPDAARIVGVNVERVHWVSVVLGFGVAGVAGVLVSMMEQFSPFIGFPFTIAAFIVIILAGLGNIAGGLIAGLLLGAIEVYGVALTSPNWRSVLLYGIFVFVLIVLPKGIFARRGRA